MTLKNKCYMQYAVKCNCLPNEKKTEYVHVLLPRFNVHPGILVKEPNAQDMTIRQ